MARRKPNQHQLEAQRIYDRVLEIDRWVQETITRPAEEAARIQAEFEQKVQEIARQETEIRRRKAAEYAAAYPPGFLYTRDVLGIEPIPGTDRWRRRKGRKKGQKKNQRPNRCRSLADIEKAIREIWKNDKSAEITHLLLKPKGHSKSTTIRILNEAEFSSLEEFVTSLKN